MTLPKSYGIALGWPLVAGSGVVRSVSGGSGGLLTLSLSASHYASGATAGQTIGLLIGLSTGSTRTLVDNHSSAVSLNIAGDTVVVGLSAPTSAGSFNITVRETPAGGGAYRDTVLSITCDVAGVAPANTVLPAISGTQTEGQVLTVSNGSWTNSPTSYAYQWYRNGVAISGSINSTRTLSAADIGTIITAAVTATNPTGSATATSAGTSAIASANPTPPVNTVAPAVTGTATVGSVLTSTAGTWSGGPTSYSYQWRRNGVDIAGATASTYTLVAADGGTSVLCRVGATSSGGTTGQVSNAIAVDVVRLPAIAVGWAEVLSLENLAPGFNGATHAVCATSAADTPASTIDVSCGANGRPDYAAAFAAYGASFDLYRLYGQVNGKNATSATAARRFTIRLGPNGTGLNTSRGHIGAMAGYNPATGAVLLTKGLDIDASLTIASRQDSAFYWLGTPALGGGLASSFGVLGNASPNQLILYADAQINATSFGLKAMTTGYAVNKGSSVLPACQGTACLSVRSSATNVKIASNAKSQTIASTFTAVAMSGGIIGYDALNSGNVATGDFIGLLIPNSNPSDADDAAIRAAVNARLSITSGSAYRYIAAPHSLAVYGNAKVWNKTLWHQTDEAGPNQLWEMGIIGTAGFTVTEAKTNPLWFSGKYDASLTVLAYELGTPANDINLGCFVGTLTNGSATITGVTSMPPWLVNGVAFVAQSGLLGTTTVSGTPDVGAGTVTMSAAFTGTTGTKLIKTVPVNAHNLVLTGTTTAGNPLVTGIADTTGVIDGAPIYGTFIGTVRTVASHTSTTITLDLGTGVTAGTGTMTTADQAKCTASGAFLATSVYAPFVTTLKAQGSNVQVVVATGWSWVGSSWVTTGATNVALEQFIRARWLLAANTALGGLSGVYLADDATPMGTFVSAGNAQYTTDSVHDIAETNVGGTGTQTNPIGAISAPIRKAILNAMAP